MLRASIILFVLGILTFCNVTIANEYTFADLEKGIQEHDKTYFIHRVGNTIYSVADFRNNSGTLDESGKCPNHNNLVRVAVSLVNKETVSFFDDCNGDGIVDHFHDGASEQMLQDAVNVLTPILLIMQSI